MKNDMGVFGSAVIVGVGGINTMQEAYDAIAQVKEKEGTVKITNYKIDDANKTEVANEQE